VRITISEFIASMQFLIRVRSERECSARTLRRSGEVLFQFCECYNVLRFVCNRGILGRLYYSFEHVVKVNGRCGFFVLGIRNVCPVHKPIPARSAEVEEVLASLDESVGETTRGK